MKRRRKTVEAIFSPHLFIFTFFCFYPVPLLSISLTIFYFIHHFSPTLSSPLLFSPILSSPTLSSFLLFSFLLFLSPFYFYSLLSAISSFLFYAPFSIFLPYSPPLFSHFIIALHSTLFLFP